MKFSYWLELPMVITALLESNNTVEDLELAKNLLNSSKAIELLCLRLEKDIDRVSNLSNINVNSNEDNYNKLLSRLNNLEKEKSLIMIQSIKFSIKLASKFLKLIEDKCILIKKNNNDSNTNKNNNNYSNLFFDLNISSVPDHYTLTKIKYFLNLIKNILVQINTYLKSKNYKESSKLYAQEHEIQFCCIVKIFFEKIESKLFNISIDFLKNINNNKYNTINDKNIEDNCFNITNLNNFNNNSNSNFILNNVFTNTIFKPCFINDFTINNNIYFSNNKKRANSMWVKDKDLDEEDAEIYSTPQIKLLRIDN